MCEKRINFTSILIYYEITVCSAKIARHCAFRHSRNTSGNKGPSKPNGDCFVCRYPGHFAKQCSKRSSAFCSKCKKRGHLPKACRSSSKPTTKPDSFHHIPNV